MLSATKGRLLYRVVTVILGYVVLSGIGPFCALAQNRHTGWTEPGIPASVPDMALVDDGRIPVELTPREATGNPLEAEPAPSVAVVTETFTTPVDFEQNPAAESPDTHEDPQVVEVYVVRRGDTLYDIARKFNTSIDALAAANRMNSRSVLHPGREITIAGKDTPEVDLKDSKIEVEEGFYYRIGSGESLWTIARRYGTTTSKLLAANEIRNPNKLDLGQEIFIPGKKEIARGVEFAWPLPERNKKISSGYGYRQDPMGGSRAFHAGIDLPASSGTPIQAAESGKVIQSGRRSFYGLCVEIEHAEGYTTRYAHASRLDVKQGQYVFRGQQIGAVGSTGRSTGPHLHFEIRKNGKALNPSLHLPK